MADAALKSYLDQIEQLETPVGYMYVDSTGNVTVGAGHNLTAHKDHKSLPFKTTSRFQRHAVLGGDTGVPITVNKVADRPATADEIQNDFAFLTKHPRLGNFTVRSGLLEKYTTLELGSDAVDALFLNDINSAVEGVKSIFGKDFDSFPLPCRAALIDIQFNTGSVNHLATVVHAAKGTGPFAGKSASERWLAAATASNRPDASSDRNNLIANWFRAGAAQAKLKKP